MQTVALIMAGGSGERMRRSGVRLPKPLVPVLGTPLLQRNVDYARRYGLNDIVVSVSERDPAVQALCEQLGVRTLLEDRPLGNIGCAGELSGTVLVLYCDNLTSLDLGAVLTHHEQTGAALTLAAHEEQFRLPYGQLTLDGTDVLSYVEKPTIPVTVCSAVVVLAPAALAVIEPPMGLVDLTNALLSAGAPVSAYVHQSPWVDVNDAASLARAEDLLRSRTEACC